MGTKGFLTGFLPSSWNASISSAGGGGGALAWLLFSIRAAGLCRGRCRFLLSALSSLSFFAGSRRLRGVGGLAGWLLRPPRFSFRFEGGRFRGQWWSKGCVRGVKLANKRSSRRENIFLKEAGAVSLIKASLNGWPYRPLGRSAHSGRRAEATCRGALAAGFEAVRGPS
jgi:hypothetical protein